ncbi:hypothetical protein AN189_13010 [Loktanella sp. 3ANDIMAR09]|uniref:hypothetical protein n=1 Tax=Loktanella sp. 3ANDIMAR09 TaxID=1225657 RepID=UPI0006FBD691|nr:hypothetical protein [Loktanella sp. 3ANDIMAR09]KQI67988.1 hypothetical protein AN189_13010 [Loktanella sp. 3ANDIMAR09]
MSRKVEYRGDMAEVVRECGKDVADEMASILSGLTLYIPRAMPDDDHVLMKLTDEAVAALMAHFGGERIYISKPHAGQVELDEITSLLGRSLPVREVAIRLGISERQVFRRIHEAGLPKVSASADPRQLSFLDDQ